MWFLDTNVLLYSISTAANETAKRARALALLDQDDCALSVQVLQEFYVQATREWRADAIPHVIAAGLIDVAALPRSGQHRGSHAGGAGNQGGSRLFLLGQRDHRRRTCLGLPRTPDGRHESWPHNRRPGHHRSISVRRLISPPHGRGQTLLYCHLGVETQKQGHHAVSQSAQAIVPSQTSPLE